MSSTVTHRRTAFRRQSSTSSAGSYSSASSRPRRGCLSQLARSICDSKQKKNVIFITGAGLSVPSGIRPFRGSSGIWSSVVWQKGTREAFKEDPLGWYNAFWLPHFHTPDVSNARPNAGHAAIHELCNAFSNIRIITQNIDGLHGPPSSRLIEAHGRLALNDKQLYKCVPQHYDSDTDSDSDEDDERLVHLGHRRKSRARKRLYRESRKAGQKTTTTTHAGLYRMTTTSSGAGTAMPRRRSLSSSSSSSSHEVHHVPCRYEILDSLTVDQLQPPSVREALCSARAQISTPPRCPACNSLCLPQALLFDEGYHSHDFYQFERMEEWLSQCDVLVFCGTSFAVRLTQVALEHARNKQLEVYNFNTTDVLEPTPRLNVSNIVGPAEETLPRLLQACRELQQQQQVEREEDSDGASMEEG